MAYLPTNAQELLSNICIMETAVTKLEEEMVSLYFQLIQERNEMRLVEYRLKQMPPPACSCHSGKLEPEDTTGKKCSQGGKVYARAVLHEQVMKLQRQISVKSLVNPNQLSGHRPLHEEHLHFLIGFLQRLHKEFLHGESAVYSISQRKLFDFCVVVSIGTVFHISVKYVILKMKPPRHRPQMALLLALQKMKVPEEQKKFCIEAPEPF